MYFVMRWKSVLKFSKNKAAVVLAGEIDVDISAYINSDSLIVAVDGGNDHLKKLNIKADIVIGDFDSTTRNVGNIETLQFLTDKDDTDFLCALKYIRKLYGMIDIQVFGFASTNRLDHVLSNLSIIDCNAQFISKNQEISLITESIELSAEGNRQFKYYSFYALEPVANFCLVGFKWELTNYLLKPFDPLCISNQLTHKIGFVKIDTGRVLMIKSREN